MSGQRTVLWSEDFKPQARWCPCFQAWQPITSIDDQCPAERNCTAWEADQ